MDDEQYDPFDRFEVAYSGYRNRMLDDYGRKPNLYRIYEPAKWSKNCRVSVAQFELIEKYFNECMEMIDHDENNPNFFGLVSKLQDAVRTNERWIRDLDSFGRNPIEDAVDVPPEQHPDQTKLDLE